MKLLNVILVLVFLSMSVSAIDINTTNALPSTNTQIDLVFQNLRYNPYPVAPGDYFEIWFKVINNGRSTASDISFELQEDFPFKIYPGESKKYSYSSIGPSSEVVFKYKVLVDEKTLEGNSVLKIKINSGGSYIREFPIQIRTRSPSLSIASISTSPDRLRQGELNNLTITLRNNEPTVMRNINAKIVLAGTIFTPLHTITEKNIRTLEPNEEIILNYEIIADPNAESGPYNIPFNLYYFDSLDNVITKNETIGVIVSSPEEIEVLLEESKAYTKGDVGDVVISVSNIGPTRLKFLTISLDESDDYKVITSPKIYLGDLDPDDFQTATFKVHVLKEEVDLKVNLNYKNALNENFNNIVNLNLPVFTSQQAIRYGFKQPSSSISSLILSILLILFIYYAYKEYRIHKELSKSLKIALKKVIRNIIDLVDEFRPKNLRTLPKRFKKWLRDDN
jgi:hypothetical protein